MGICAVLVCIFLAVVLLKLYLYLTTGRYTIKKSLKGKHILITGGTAGIGRETVRELASHGATVHMLSRDSKKMEKMIEELKAENPGLDIKAHELNLSSFRSVRQFASNYLQSGLPIHVLINNAGLANKDKRVTEDGNEEMCQVNHLSHFLLTNLLLDKLIESGPGSRIVNVSSAGHNQAGEFNVSDLNFEHQPFSMYGVRAYGYSKLENILFTRELARRLYGKGVTVNALHPGSVRTELARDYPPLHPMALILKIVAAFSKTPNEGAQTSIFLAVADEVANVSGHYFSDCKVGATTLLAVDDKMASDLWEESIRLTSLKS